ncbi:MAG: hypothetical protein HY313_01235 [Acidobacteria bacterium]|nr:hypothetical protein [Acidobacteriota bacterium]
MTEPDIHLTLQPKNTPEGKHSIFLWTAASLFVVIGATSAILFLSSPPESAPAPLPSQEDIAYAGQLQLSELHLSAEKNFLGQQVVYLDGKIANRGNKTVRQLKVRLFFRDYYSQVILQEDQPMLAETAPPLAPGQTHNFQLRFDSIADSWNRQIPQFQLVSIGVQ